MQLIEAIHGSASAIDNEHQVDLILLDFLKAFDHVSHSQFHSKLNYYGIHNKTQAWIQAFLSNRSQCVSVNGVLSKCADVTSGVPHGSVLGPVLFLVYINDISDCISSNKSLFADDSILYRQINSPQVHQILQEDLNKLCKWSEDWLMDFNVTKSYLMTITTKLYLPISNVLSSLDQSQFYQIH